MACARWLLPVPPGPRNNASSRLLMNTAVARSKTKLRFIFGLKVKSRLSRVRSVSRKAAVYGVHFRFTAVAYRHIAFLVVLATIQVIQLVGLPEDERRTSAYALRAPVRASRM